MDDAQQRIHAVVTAFARGELVIVADDDDRENEGDLFVAASLCTPEKMAFIIRHTSGIVCAPLAQDEARRLHLDPMVAHNDAPLGTAFTVSVDARHGLTTGISAEERTNTVRALANGNMGAADFVRPGHVFPLVAKEGGVLMRSGHTEACVDLCRLAGLPPVGVLAELMNDDGTVMRGPEIAAFAARHKLARVSIADLIAYRQARERLIERVGEFPVESEIGTLSGYAFRTPFDPFYHVAFVYGDIGDGRTCRRGCIAPTSSSMFSAAPKPSARRSSVSRPRAGAFWSCCATAPPACRSSPFRNRTKPRPARRAAANGARSASARRSSRISASARSGC